MAKQVDNEVPFNINQDANTSDKNNKRRLEEISTDSSSSSPKIDTGDNKKQRQVASSDTSNNATVTKSTSLSLQQHSAETQAPAYGTQEYWEDRYSYLHSQKNTNESSPSTSKQQSSSPKNPESNNTDDPAAFHEWYFTYNELRPLLLPLILGDTIPEQMDKNDESATDTELDKKMEAKVAREGELDEDVGKHVQTESDRPVQATQEEMHLETESNESGGRKSTVKEREEEKDSNVVESAGVEEDDESEGGISNHNEEEVEEVVVEEEWESCGDDEDEEMEIVREGLAKMGPVSVLEVGCGDVPLVNGLASEMKKFEAATGSSVQNVVDKIVCCDYSDSVIQFLNERNTDAGDTVPVDYVVADARKLPYPDDNFHLVLEKGTLDAVLSDANVGLSNCIQIVTECSRVLKDGGYFVIISHHNAHTSKGLQFVHEAIRPGLHGGASSWSIEVHGSNNEVDDGKEKESKADDSGFGLPQGSAAGPVVYILQKKEGKAEDENDNDNNNNNDSKNQDESALEINFYSY